MPLQPRDGRRSTGDARRRAPPLRRERKARSSCGAQPLPVPPLVAENTKEPRLGRPAPLEQRFGCWVVDDPAVADEKASLRDRNDIAKRGHPVLQGSPTAANQPLAATGRA